MAPGSGPDAIHDGRTEGMSQKQVATEMGISIKTVGAHMQNVLGTLGVHSRMEAVARAARASATSEA